jgi:hypothetical protein
MIHPPASASRISAGHAAAEQMATALQARALGAAPFSGLSPEASVRLASACDQMAALIRAGEDVPEPGMNLRSGASFLVCTLSALRARGVSQPLSPPDEAWMLEEVESELGDANALFETRMRNPTT